MIEHSEKKKIISALLEPLAILPGIVSVSVVGSLSDRDSIGDISDMDVIVICEKLSPNIFDACLQAVSSIRADSVGMPGKQIVINSTFGPIKYDAANTAVIHVMLYDRPGHRQHVLNSPFTCYDWERSPHHEGLPLSRVYPVLRLQPRDFLDARRGIRDYIDDLDHGCLSYRRYIFDSLGAREITERKPLDPRHRGEYAFHIVKNLVANYCKLMLQKNILLSERDLVNNWRRFLPGSVGFIALFEQLAANRKHRHFPEETVDRAREFLLAFETEFNRVWGTCPRVVFIRHAQTPLNDGTFLGQRRDPRLGSDVRIAPLPFSVDRVFASPLQRSIETARRLVPGGTPTLDPRLREIDYGKAEGMTLAELKRSFPAVIAGWSCGEDTPFPDGENTMQVRRRIQSFVESGTWECGTSLVVTHNVVLRCLVGWLYGIPAREWHHIDIPHLEPMEVMIMNGQPHPNFPLHFKAAVADAVTGFGESNHA